MALVSFSEMPDDARVWVFGAAAPITGPAANALLKAVDGWLDRWKAHGASLRCARDWRDDRFLAIAADERATGATGCSVDRLVHELEQIEANVGTSLLGSGQVFWRDAAGVVQVSERPAFRARGAAGEITGATRVFDTTVLTAGAWRTRFELAARDAWHARLLGLGPGAPVGG